MSDLNTTDYGARGALSAEAREEGLVEVERALSQLRREIETRFTKVPMQRSLRSVDWMAFFDDLRRRFSTFGMSERSGEIDEFGMDEVVLLRSRALLDFLLQRYWRVEISGLGALPAPGPCLFVANRSGLLPYDGLAIAHVLAAQQPEAGQPRFLVADWLITLPFVQSYLARLGGVRACRENAERLLSQGQRVIAFPEGQQGAAKVFRKRYRLQRFGRGGVVRLAIERGVPLVPVAVVGAEEIHPILFKVGAPARALGLPFLPVTPTFPALGLFGFLPLPSKWGIHFGAPLPIESLGPDDARDELLVARLTEELRQSIQSLLDEHLKDRKSIWS